MYRKTSESRNKERTQPLVLFSVYLLGGINNTQISEKKNPHTVMVLSAQPMIIHVPVVLKVEQKAPASASSESGCGMSSSSSSGSIGIWTTETFAGPPIADG